MPLIYPDALIAKKYGTFKICNKKAVNPTYSKLTNKPSQHKTKLLSHLSFPTAQTKPQTLLTL